MELFHLFINLLCEAEVVGNRLPLLRRIRLPKGFAEYVIP